MSHAHNHIWNSTEAVLLCGLDGIRWLSVLDSRSSMVLAETETDHKNCTKCLWIAQNAKVIRPWDPKGDTRRQFLGHLCCWETLGQSCAPPLNMPSMPSMPCPCNEAFLWIFTSLKNSLHVQWISKNQTSMENWAERTSREFENCNSSKWPGSHTLQHKLHDVATLVAPLARVARGARVAGGTSGQVAENMRTCLSFRTCNSQPFWIYLEYAGNCWKLLENIGTRCGIRRRLFRSFLIWPQNILRLAFFENVVHGVLAFSFWVFSSHLFALPWACDRISLSDCLKNDLMPLAARLDLPIDIHWWEYMRIMICIDMLCMYLSRIHVALMFLHILHWYACTCATFSQVVAFHGQAGD